MIRQIRLTLATLLFVFALAIVAIPVACFAADSVEGFTHAGTVTETTYTMAAGVTNTIAANSSRVGLRLRMVDSVGVSTNTVGFGSTVTAGQGYGVLTTGTVLDFVPPALIPLTAISFTHNGNAGSTNKLIATEFSK